jgi:hypothetical protein
VALLRQAAVDGQLAVPTAPLRQATPATTLPPAGSAVEAHDSAVVHTWLPIALVSSAAAAGVHGAAGPAHFADGMLVGSFFVLSAAGQLGWVLLVLALGPTTWLLRAALLGNAGVVVVWLLSRTIGLPGGPGEVEPVGPWDLAATGWEMAVLIGVSLVLTSGRFVVPACRLLDIVRWSAVAHAWLAASVMLMLALTVTGTSA